MTPLRTRISLRERAAPRAPPGPGGPNGERHGLAPSWHPIDITVLVIYFIAMIGIGVAVVRRASRGLDSYFLAGNELPWYVLGVSNASAMFDITGTMWLVYNIFVYRRKGHLAALALAHLQPGLPGRLPRVLDPAVQRPHRRGVDHHPLRRGTGGRAQSDDRGRVRPGERRRVHRLRLPGHGQVHRHVPALGLVADTYGIIVMAITAIYVLLGGMISVVLTDVAQFVIMAICSLAIAIIAMRDVSAEQIAAVVPEGGATSQ